jgi:hypothetical protein
MSKLVERCPKQACGQGERVETGANLVSGQLASGIGDETGIRAFAWNRRTCRADDKGEVTSGKDLQGQEYRSGHRGGGPGSSDEAVVMTVEPSGPLQAAPKARQPRQREERARSAKPNQIDKWEVWNLIETSATSYQYRISMLVSCSWASPARPIRGQGQRKPEHSLSGYRRIERCCCSAC